MIVIASGNKKALKLFAELDFNNRTLAHADMDYLEYKDKLFFLNIVKGNLDGILGKVVRMRSKQRFASLMWATTSAYHNLSHMSSKIIGRGRIEQNPLIVSNYVISDKEKDLYVTITEDDASTAHVTKGRGEIGRIVVSKSVFYIAHMYAESAKDYIRTQRQSMDKKWFLLDTWLETPLTVIDTQTDASRILDFFKMLAEPNDISDIYMTMYRVDKDGLLIESLCAAAKRGVNVTVFVETRASGERENFGKVVATLLAAGVVCILCSKFTSRKVHMKCTLVCRKGAPVLALVGTGNYKESTLGRYNDIHVAITDVTTLTAMYWMFSSGRIRDLGYMRNMMPNENFDVEYLIGDEIKKSLLRDLSSVDDSDHLYLKCNNIFDEDVIKGILHTGASLTAFIRTTNGFSLKLVETSRELSTMSIISRCGSALDHERIYIFPHCLYISSADLAPKNLNNRIEGALRIDAKHHPKTWTYFRNKLAKEASPELNPNSTIYTYSLASSSWINFTEYKKNNPS